MHYTDLDGNPVTNAFIEADRTDGWIYLDENGEPVSGQFVESTKGTPWYVWLTYGTSHDVSSAFLLEEQDTDALYYLKDFSQGAGIVQEAWRTRSSEKYQLPIWHYFARDGKAVTGKQRIDGVSYTFDEAYRCVLPGWNETEKGRLYFADESFEPVNKAFAVWDEETSYYLKDGAVDATGEVHEIRVNRNVCMYQAEEVREEGNAPNFRKITTDKPFADSAISTIYFLIDETGRVLKEQWNDTETKYYGKDGKAYQNGRFEIDGKFYNFDKEGEVKIDEPIEEETLPKVVKALAKLLKNLHVAEDKVNSEEEAAAFIREYIEMGDYLPEGIAIATISTASRSDAFRAAENGVDGHYFYNITIYDETEDEEASPSAAWKRQRSEEPEISTGSVAGRKTATAKNNKLIIDAAVPDVPDREQAMRELETEIKDMLKMLTLQQSDADDMQGYLLLVKKAVNDMLPNGYTAELQLIADQCNPPVPGNSADPTGQEGTAAVDVWLHDSAGTKGYVSGHVMIAPTPYDGASREVFERVQDYLDELELETISHGTAQDYAEYVQDKLMKLVPKGYRTEVMAEESGFIAPVAGSKAEPDGKNGTISLKVLVEDKIGNRLLEEVDLVILAKAYEAEPEEPEKPEPEKPETPDPEKPEKPVKPSRPGSSSGGGSSSNRPFVKNDTRGELQQLESGQKRFLKADTNTYAQNEWAKVDGKWYYFNNNTQAVSGWNLIEGKWYFLNENDQSMQLGWHADGTDGNWYYLNKNGTLATGWIMMDGRWYYLNEVSEGATYIQTEDGSWKFNGEKNRPYGAMWKDGITPDGYKVGADGAWDGKPAQKIN
ncbi:MAG: hypothetical protein Q4C63_07530 [Eubacteriales bacterium]|nr:hypothetical protein [Eubacteriales bacterium]